MILSLHVAWERQQFTEQILGRLNSTAREKSLAHCCGLATARTEKLERISLPPDKPEARYGIVAFLGGILT